MNRWKERLLERVVKREEIDGLVEPRVPADWRYKKEKFSGAGDHPDLSVGAKVICRWHEGNDLVGYYLGIVLDYDNARRPRYWIGGEDVIVQVTAISNERMEHLVGRLRVVQFNSWSRSAVGMSPPLLREDYGLARRGAR